jgi:hypothetical protein
MRGSRAALTALWVALALVVVVSGWVGVDMVGEAITPTAVKVLSDKDMDALLTKATPTPTKSHEAKHDGTSDKNKQDDKAGSKDHQGSTQPTTTTTSSPTTSSSTSPDTTKVVYRTFRSRGGSAIVSCTGSRIALENVSPAPGYRVDERKVGRSELEVKFDGEGGESSIRAQCQSGVPVAQIDSDS